jgi:hypothetical protein
MLNEMVDDRGVKNASRATGGEAGSILWVDGKR